MAIPNYATSADFTTLYPEAVAPANITAQLRLASRLVRRDTASAIYDVLDDTVTPSDPDIAEAFKDAVCAQVNGWAALGLDPFAGGLMQPGQVKTSKSLDGKSIGYDNTLVTSAAALAQRRQMIEELVPEAAMILRDALYGLARPYLRG